MSGRGELFTFESPLSAARRALVPRYAAACAEDGRIQVRDELDKLVCRISVLTVPGGSSWLTLEPLRGYEQDSEQIRAALLGGGFRSEDNWKDPRVSMARGERSDEVVRRVLARLLEIQDANLPGALADSDPEFLHDYRVSIRRARSVLREMRGVFAPDDLERVRASYKWLQDQTSATRDLDVYLEDFDQVIELAPESRRADLAALEPVLRERLRRARAGMETMLSGVRARALREEWARILAGLVDEDEGGRPDATRPIGDLAGERIRKVHRTMVKMGRAIDQDSRPEQYHELRKKGKELRYLLELFGAQLFEPDVVRPLIKALKALQDVLGLHQDREVQIEMLKELGHELARLPDGPRVLMAIGTLIDRLESDAEAARGEFADTFAQFASDAQCKLVADAFH